MKEKTFIAERGAIHYWVSARIEDAPQLVFLPGLTADHRLFDRQIAHFERQANCLVWDPPSHGASRPFALDWSMDDLARMLHAILEREGFARPILVGQSMGGYVPKRSSIFSPAKRQGSFRSTPARLRASTIQQPSCGRSSIHAVCTRRSLGSCSAASGRTDARPPNTGESSCGR